MGSSREDREIVLLLLRTTNPSGADSWEPVPETEYILRWYNRDSDVWNYSFEGLPRRDADDNTLYTYRVVEQITGDDYDSIAEPGISLLADESSLFVYNFTNVQQG